MESLINTDQQLFLGLNSLHNGHWDVVMYWITNKYTWIPLYLGLLVHIIKVFGRSSIYIILTLIAAAGLADFIASGIMKPLFMRPRPCHDPIIGHLVHTISGCGGKYGFSSSHASTSFALATSAGLLLYGRLKGVNLLFLWALIYSYSRIYAGVHYPSDIIAGAMVGILSGLLCVRVYSFILIKGNKVH